MLTLSELLELDNNTILTGSDSDGNRYLSMMLELYSETFGQSCFSCSKRFPGYLNQLRNLKMTSTKTEKTSATFELKKDTMIPIPGTSESYSDKNLTDEAALKILARNKNAKSLFKTLPENWEEQVEAYKAGSTKVNSIEELANLSYTAIKALFPDVSGRSKTELLENIAEKYPALVKEDDLDPETDTDTEETDTDSEETDTDTETDTDSEESAGADSEESETENETED